MDQVNESILFALTVGIIASLLSVLLSLLFREIWIKILIPWYEERLYKGAEIEGVWHSITEYEDGGKNEVVYKLQRKGHRIWGEFSSISGIDKGKKWSFHGQFKDLVLNIIYESDDPRILDKGSMAMMLNHNGEKLTGHLIYYANDGNQMKSTQIELIPGYPDDGKSNN